ncbi:MAG: hypothetical protein EZS28_011731 [Streblomastix strix]|uniref:Uncharacterized protein n=1 Tax=Streblomastix strix TaxID=222440 RepID=A0A5J4WE03_9EUKA|nr:MAG: hypothetical protein EZS28_011731 [Streblomastix strix]
MRELDIRDLKDEKRMEQDSKLSNFEQLTEDRSNIRVETVSMLQLQLSFVQLQMNAVNGFNGTWNLFEIPPTSYRGGQKAMIFENNHLCIRYSDPELGSHNIAARSPVSYYDSTRVYIVDCDTQESDDSYTNKRVIWIVLDQLNNNNADNSFRTERNIEITETIHGSGQVKEVHKRMSDGISNQKSRIYKRTIQIRHTSHNTALKAK